MTTTQQDYKVSMVPGASGIRARLAIKAAGDLVGSILTLRLGARRLDTEAVTRIAAVEAQVAIASALLDVADAIRSLKSPTA